MLEHDAVKLDGLVVRGAVSRETNVGDGRTLLAQLDAENVHIFPVDGQKLGQFIAQLLDFALDDVLSL